MANRYFIVLTGLLMIAALAAALWGRPALFPTEARSTPSDMVRKQLDPPTDEAIVVYYHERRPYYVTTPNQVHGLIADRVNWVFKDAGIPFVWRKTPAKRQLEVIRNNTQEVCAVGWFKTPEREAFAKYSQVIYQDLPAIALAHADNANIHSPAAVEDLLSNRNLILLKKDGYSYGAFLDNLIATLVPRQEVTTARNDKMLEMIRLRHADYFFIAKEEADILTGAPNFPRETFQYIHFSNMPSGNKRYALFSHEVEDEVIERINSILERLPEQRIAKAG